MLESVPCSCWFLNDCGVPAGCSQSIEYVVLVVVVAVMVINLFKSIVACVSVCWLMIVVEGQA